MAWVETQSPSFSARHDSAATDGAHAVLADLERFRTDLENRFPETPGEVTVVLHSHAAQLALAQPWLPLAQLVSAPAGRRYFGGWFAAGEVHVLAPDLLERRASRVSGSLEAMRRAPRHEYTHLVVGRNNAGLPPPFSPRSFRGYLRWAWLCEGAATYFSGQERHLGAAIARRLREGPQPTLPPSARDAMLLGGSVYGLLEASRGPDACVALARSSLAGETADGVIGHAFGSPVGEVARAWREHLGGLTAAGP